MEGVNLGKMDQIHNLVRTLTFPWIIIGEFNVVLEAMEASGFVELIGGHILTGNQGANTCHQGRGS
mgnify:CR=1 FL=1